MAAALIPPKTLVSRHAMPDIFVEPGWDDFFKEPDERINPNTGVSLPNHVCCSNVSSNTVRYEVKSDSDFRNYCFVNIYGDQI